MKCINRSYSFFFLVHFFLYNFSNKHFFLTMVFLMDQGPMKIVKFIKFLNSSKFHFGKYIRYCWCFSPFLILLSHVLVKRSCCVGLLFEDLIDCEVTRKDC